MPLSGKKTLDSLIQEFGISKESAMEIFNAEREKAEIEKALHESEIKYKDLFDNAPVGYHELDLNGAVIRVNKTELNMLGYTEDEMIGRPIWEFISDYDVETARQSFASKIKGVFEQGKGFERRYKRKDGKDIIVLIYDRLLFNSEGLITGVTSTIEDITEKREAEEKLKLHAEELREANAAKDKFFSIIAHDLKSPFMGLLGLTDILQNDFETMSLNQLRKFINDIDGASKKIYRLLENLLTWSRLQVGKMPFSPSEVDFTPFCANINSLLNGNAENKHIGLNFNVEEGIKIYADENMLCSVMTNLISNALKFTPSGGNVTINARLNHGNLEVGVTDTGNGIRPDDLKKLFRIDAQYSTKGTAGEMGTGLGLLLCKEMIERHNGKIWVESEFGKGSSFRFTIPAFSDLTVS
jgi:PAS domain S-box-containing protein